MNLLKISWANIKDKPLNTFLSLLLLAFGIGLISFLLLIQNQMTAKFEKNIKDIDMVLGAKGSPLQLILSAVYQVDAPTGNISYQEAKKVMKNRLIQDAIPLAYGDNYQKYRIVGTNHKYPEHYQAALGQGRLWEKSFEVTLGAKVADETHLKIGDHFASAHGLDQAGEKHDEHNLTVVGIFKPTGTVVDRLILTEIASIWEVHEHHDEDRAEQHNHEKEITAVLLKKRSPMAMVMLPNQLKNSNMQLALTAIEVNRLTANFGMGMKALSMLGIIVVFISFISVFISLYSSLKDRKYELALIRTIGGSRKALFVLILLEGLLIALVGFFCGLILSRIGLLLLSYFMEDQFQYALNDLNWTSNESKLLVITLLVGVLASFLPAYQAVKIDISKTLSDE